MQPILAKNPETAAHPALRVIAVYKLLKAAALIVLAIGAFGLVRTEWLEDLTGWIADLPIRSGHTFLLHWANRLLDLSPARFELIGAGALVYASVFVAEGWGLWRGKRWAEYLTVFATASLIPLELWELARHVTTLKIVAVLVNVAIVIYLWRLVHQKG